MTDKWQISAPNLFESDEENKKFNDLFNNFILKELDNMILSNSPEIRKFLEILISSILLELNKKFPEPLYSVYITYRIKSSQSDINKLEDYLKRLANTEDGISIKEFTDLIGLRIVVEKIPHNISVSKKDPNYEQLKRLSDERKKNIKLSEEYNDFKVSIEDETCTSFEYYTQSKKLIQDILNMINSTHSGLNKDYANNLKSTYMELLDICDKKIMFLSAIGDYESIIGQSEMDDTKYSSSDEKSSKKINYIKLLQDFDSRIDSKLGLTLYTNYYPELIKNSDSLKALGVKVSEDPNRTKLKAEKSGFISYFFGNDFQDIPLKMESQIMFIDEHLASILGYSTHSNMKDKNYIPGEIPSAYSKRMMYRLKNLGTSNVFYSSDLTLLNKIVKNKKLSEKELKMIYEITDNYIKNALLEQELDESQQEILKQICLLTDEQSQNIEKQLYSDGIEFFNSWAEYISASHVTARLDKDSSAKNRVKFFYDDPYECLAHIMRQQVEGYNFDSSYSNMIDAFLSLIYKKQEEWIDNTKNISSTSSVMDFEINDYIENEFPKLKEKLHEKDSHEL